jgi:hypothetical protein
MSTSKPRVIKDFEKLDKEIREQIKLVYSEGFAEHLVYYTNKDGNQVTALPFETDDKYYLVRMTVSQAEAIIEEDDDYDIDGNLTDKAKEKYEDKYADLDYLAEQLSDDEGNDEDDDE